MRLPEPEAVRPGAVFRGASLLAWLTGFTATNAFVAAAISAANLPFAELASDPAGVVFLALALPAHFLLFGALLSAPPLLLGWVTRRPMVTMTSAAFLQAIWICVVLVNAKVFELYRFHLNGMVANMVFGGALQDQVVLSGRAWAQVMLIVTSVATLEIVAARAWWQWRLARRPTMHRVLWTWWAGALLMLVSQGMVAYHDARGDRTVVSLVPYVPWALAVTAKDAFGRVGIRPRDGPGQLDAGDGLLVYPRHPLQCDGRPGLNIVIILVESLRFDALSPQTMPNTWRYAQRSLDLRNHYSAGNASRFGVFGLMYGLPGGYWHAMLAEQRGSVLIGELQRLGYGMHIYGSAPLYSPEFDRTVFSDVRDRIRHGPRKRRSAERDREILQRLQADIVATPPGQRFFGFVFLDSPHQPYYLPSGWRSPFRPIAQDVNPLEFGPQHDPTPVFNRYRASVRYSDELIGRFLDALEAGPYAQDTVVLITGDHGEEFNDLGRNYWGHNGNFSDYQLRTPFVLHWPGKPPRTVESPTSHEDFVPTVMRHALGCRNGIADYSTGRDLFAPLPASRPLVVESWSKRAIRNGARIYVFDRYGMPTVLDSQYRPLPNEQADPLAVRQAWEMLTRFQPQ